MTSYLNGLFAVLGIASGIGLIILFVCIAAYSWSYLDEWLKKKVEQIFR